nr:cytochrome c biogenesis CcdA family protein [Sphingomonas sp. TREG-RG-20F-R18-01]
MAGVVSILSPCVLPLVPIVFGTAQSRHRFGPLALGAGLAISFTLVGLFVATIGFSIGLDGDAFRAFGGAILIAFGLLLMIPSLQTRFAAAVAPIGAWADRLTGGFQGNGLVGQGAMGVLLGLVWAPCVGPTLGAASMLAAQGDNLGTVALVMMAFGIGAATPLVIIGFASGSAMRRMRIGMRSAGKVGKIVLGLVLLAIGLSILTGFDRMLEAALTDWSPEWLVRFTTRF